jgi:hypothetical protein
LSAEALRFFQGQDCPTFDPAPPPGPFVPPSLQEIYLFHVETGMRIWELYARQGVDEMSVAGSLARAASSANPIGRTRTTPGRGRWRPWASGRQTIGGSVSTATHGGDVDYGAICDAVLPFMSSTRTATTGSSARAAAHHHPDPPDRRGQAPGQSRTSSIIAMMTC